MTQNAASPRVLPLTAALADGGRAVRAATALLAACVAFVALRALGLLGGAALGPTGDHWLYAGCDALAAAIVIARARLVPRSRRAWLALGVGIAFSAAGNLYAALGGGTGGGPPTPADWLYLMFYPLACGAMASAIVRHARGVRAAIWLDAAVAALTVAAILATFVFEPVIRTHSSAAAVTTELAYPLADLTLIVLALVAFALAGWRPGRTLATLTAGFVVTAVADGVHLVHITEGSHRVGPALGALWSAGAALLALAAWSAPREREPHATDEVIGVVLPCVFGAVSIGLLVRGNYVHLGTVAESLAGAALLAAMARFTLTFGEVRRLSGIREREAATDDLTGLSNRRRFYSQLASAIEGSRRRGGSFALLTIDLDRFKELNDTLGHYAGDQLLAQIGPRMQGVLRGDVIARLGGDEFGLIVRDASAAVAVAERLRRALGRPFELEELTVTVQASVGIAVYPDDAQSPEGLLRRADAAMHQAKTDRSRYAFYAPGRETASRERLGLVTELKGAIEQGGLVVHYQPQVDMRTNTVSGVEALVRWQHPWRGLLSPDQFVPVAEQTGVMRELTASVLEQALGQQRAWLDEGRELALAVNVSATNLLDAAFLGDLRARLERWRTPPGMLRLEITESVLIAEGSRVRSVIESLGDLGVNLSLDDFGTGYSPLSYLRELPVTEIKIDRSFVEAMMSDRDTATIVRAVIGLARRLGIDVVAEGIETAGQLEMLRSFECPFAQGYLFSRPLAAPVVGRWLREDALAHIAEEVLAADGLLPPQTAGAPIGREAGALVWPGPRGRRAHVG